MQTETIPAPGLSAWHVLIRSPYRKAVKSVTAMSRAEAGRMVAHGMDDAAYDLAALLLSRMGAWARPEALKASLAYGPGAGASRTTLVAAAVIVRSLETD